MLNEGGTMTIARCNISNNSAIGVNRPDLSFSFGGTGGGILNRSGGSLVITQSTISDNSCSFGFFLGGSLGGGGVRNLGSMTIRNCTISGNSMRVFAVFPDTTIDGGGILNEGNLQITSSTIAYNSALDESGENAAFGGGIYGPGATTTDSSIIALNSAPTGPDFTGAGGLQSMGYNIIGNNADAVISSQPTDQIGTPAAPIDPLVDPLANNGGTTLTHGLAVCRGAWPTGAKACSCVPRSASNGGWARAFRWDHHSCGSGGAS